MAKRKIESQQEKHFKCKEKIFGQFFTPVKVADFIINLASLHIQDTKSACDPACGDGVFLSSMLKNGFKEVTGVDIEEGVMKSMDSELREKSKILAGNALPRKNLYDNGTLPENYFDLVAGNPPFSAKYGRIKERGVLSAYKLGSRVRSQAIEVLFLERFVQLAKKSGIIGIILPDGIFLNINYRKVREFILNNCKVLAVISLPRGIFNSSKSTTSKTSVLFALKGEKHEGEVFMAEVESLNELDDVFEIYKEHNSNSNAFWVNIIPDTLSPKSYLTKTLSFKEPSFKLKELINEMFCGSTEYGSKRKFCENGIPFISAKVVTYLGIDFPRDRKFIEPNSIMDKKKAHTRIGDVLFVRVGVGCSGRTVVITDEKDLGIADDWIYIIRVNQKISPYYLAVFMQSKYGMAQINYAKRGVGTVTIPQRLLKEIEIPILPVQFQLYLEKAYKEMVATGRMGLYDKADRIYKDMVTKIEEELQNARICKD